MVTRFVSFVLLAILSFEAAVASNKWNPISPSHKRALQKKNHIRTTKSSDVVQRLSGGGNKDKAVAPAPGFKLNVAGGIKSGLGAFLGFAALFLMNDHVLASNKLSCLCPPLGAVAVLLFCMPKVPASQPKAVIGGHLVAGIVSYLVVNSGLPYPELFSVSAAISVMVMLGVTHPPAGAYAFFFAFKKFGAQGILFPGLAGALTLVAVQKAYLSVVDI